MKYVGGKHRFATQLVSLFGDLSDRAYIEPFCGSATVIAKVSAAHRVANDAHPYLISMLSAVRDGWLPPETITFDDYNSIRHNPDSYDSALVGFVGFACSFGAKWFGGYARGGVRNYALEGRRNLQKLAAGLIGVKFCCGDYREIPLPAQAFIYCDPPYASTQGYSVGRFDTDQFWIWVRDKSDAGHDVVISEFTAPPDFMSVWSHTRAASLDRNTGGKRSTEHIFVRR